MAPIVLFFPANFMSMFSNKYFMITVCVICMQTSEIKYKIIFKK